MKILTRSLLLSVLMIAAVVMYAQKGGGDAELRKTIQELNHKMVGAVLSGNDGKVLMFYADDAISLPNYGKMLRGIDAIAAQQKESAEMGNKMLAMNLTTKKVTAYGDAVVEIGIYAVTVQLAGMPEPIKDAGKYLTVWKKYGDTYKIVNEIWNANTHPMEGMKKDDGNEKPKPTDAEIKDASKEDAEKESKGGSTFSDKKGG